MALNRLGHVEVPLVVQGRHRLAASVHLAGKWWQLVDLSDPGSTAKSMGAWQTVW